MTNLENLDGWQSVTVYSHAATEELTFVHVYANPSEVRRNVERLLAERLRHYWTAWSESASEFDGAVVRFGPFLIGILSTRGIDWVEDGHVCTLVEWVGACEDSDSVEEWIERIR